MSKGRPPKSRSPQEKKALSYKKDRRNAYGENDKASRKGIPRSKARAARADRREAAQVLGRVEREPEELAVTLESSLRHDIERKGGKVASWKKMPDVPLGDMIKCKLQRRKDDFGAKIARRNKARGE